MKKKCETKVQKSLDIITQACNELGLKINVNKTKVMNFMRRQGGHTYTYKIQGAEIETVKQYKYLGIVYTSTLNMTAHSEYVAKKGNR